MKTCLSVLSFLTLYTASLIFAQDAEHKKWPAGLMHPDLPVYQAGKFKGWNQWDKSNTHSIFMIIEETNPTDLEKYITQLKTAGFEEKNTETYHKENFDVKLQFNSPTILQISSSKIAGMEWPKVWLKGIPEPNKGTLTNMIEPSEEMPDYLQLYYINLTPEDVDAWLQALIKAGFSVEEHRASKANVSLGEKTYQSLRILIEDNGTNEWMVDFKYSN